MRSLLLVDAIHRLLRALGEHELHGVRRPLLGGCQRFGFLPGRGRQDIVGGVPAGRRTAEAHLHPQEVGTEDRDQRLDAVVTARTSATHLDTDAAERQVGIIVDGDHVSRVEAVEAREAPDRLPRSVVVRLWLHEEHALAVAPRLSEERPMRLTLHSDAPARRQPVDDAEAGVVPAACVPPPRAVTPSGRRSSPTCTASWMRSAETSISTNSGISVGRHSTSTSRWMGCRMPPSTTPTGLPTKRNGTETVSRSVRLTS